MSELAPPLYDQIRRVLLEAQSSVSRAVNMVMVHAYFEIGHLIVEDEQHGRARAEYGEETLKILSERLTVEFGRGFSRQNLQNMKQFYQSFQNCQTLSGKLSWSHYTLLMRLDDEHDKKETIARYTLPEGNTQIFASKYKLYLPTEDELIREVDEVAKRLEGVKTDIP
ncbi:MAG: DUF1016 N-terminal domain-containing protein [Euryarchaeota archaeon]|nr:DUF1016 N-terminal domain-containing protein [Euryarchaeota archaeon]